MIGNEQDARLAAAGEIGDGLGSGCSRSGLRVGDVVYKVEHDYFGMNDLEYRTFEELRALGFPYLAPVSRYEVDGKVVLAMPYYERAWWMVNTPQEFYNLMEPFFASHQDRADLLWDVSGGNLRIDSNGDPVIIDMQWNSDFNRIVEEYET